jgi:hypothetical protein
LIKRGGDLIEKLDPVRDDQDTPSALDRRDDIYANVTVLPAPVGMTNSTRRRPAPYANRTRETASC